MTDPIVEEVREARRKHSERFRNDLHAICIDLRKKEKEYEHRLISFPPKFLKEETTPK